MILRRIDHSSNKKLSFELILEDELANMFIARQIFELPRLTRIFTPAKPIVIQLIRIDVGEF